MDRGVVSQYATAMARLRLLAGYVAFGAGGALSLTGWQAGLELDGPDALGLFAVVAGVRIVITASSDGVGNRRPARDATP